MMYGYVLFIVTVFLLKCSDTQDIETIEAVVGDTAELPCNVTAETEGAKLTVLAWYRNGSATAFYSGDLRGESSKVVGSDRYRLVEADGDGLQKLQILSVRAADAGYYRCLADFSASPALHTYIKLIVIEPPQRLWVIYENGTRVTSASAGSNTSRNIGPYYIGDVLHLFCVAYGGKPQPLLSWAAEGRILKESCTPLSEQRVRSDLTYGPLRREDHGRVITCFANNNEKTPPLSIDIVVEMYLPPELVAIRVSGERADKVFEARVSAGEPLALQCRVLGARPLPAVLWRLDDAQLANLEQNVTKEPSQRLIVSEIYLSITPEFDESRITCCVPAYQRDEKQYMCATGLPLCVLYPPIVQIVVKEELDNNDTLSVTKGSNVTITCSYKANPAVHQILWYHEDEELKANDESGDVSMEATRALVAVTKHDAGEYKCLAFNEQGSTYSEPLFIDVTYPAYCEDESTVEYGVGSSESINLTCKVKANPAPTSYRWMFISESNASKLTNETHTLDTDGPTYSYERPNDTTYTLIYCWGHNGVVSGSLPQTKCSFLVTDETAPQPPGSCLAVRDAAGITVTCVEGHDGGLPQKFKFSVQALDSDEEITSSINQEPKFIIPEPKQESYTFVIKAFNDKGDSKPVEIDKDSIIDETEEAEETISAVTNITTLALSLCGGVALLALAACGLVLCAHERSERADLPLDRSDPPLCAYNTEESNCDTFHDSDDGSECNIRRTDSFRRAMGKYPSKNYDVKRTSSFHSARYMADNVDHDMGKVPRHTSSCRVHSLQNISRKRDMDVLCDHLVMHLPPETNYNVAKPMNTFYTMPRKMRHKAAKEISDETSEITQTSDGFSLPPPPDEFGTYRAASRIKDVPPKATPTYSTIIRKNSSGKDPNKYSNVIISPMNTVGLPTISGHTSVYTYPDDDHHGHQVNTNPFDDSP